jgi:hypothetical protein
MYFRLREKLVWETQVFLTIGNYLALSQPYRSVVHKEDLLGLYSSKAL